MTVQIPTTFLTGAVASVGGAIVMLGWRIRETQRPVTIPPTLIPSLGMSTGFMMFLFPPSRISVSESLGAFVLGALVPAFGMIVRWRVGMYIAYRRLMPRTSAP